MTESQVYKLEVVSPKHLEAGYRTKYIRGVSADHVRHAAFRKYSTAVRVDEDHKDTIIFPWKHPDLVVVSIAEDQTHHDLDAT